MQAVVVAIQAGPEPADCGSWGKSHAGRRLSAAENVIQRSVTPAEVRHGRTALSLGVEGGVNGDRGIGIDDGRVGGFSAQV